MNSLMTLSTGNQYSKSNFTYFTKVALNIYEIGLYYKARKIILLFDHSFRLCKVQNFKMQKFSKISNLHCLQFEVMINLKTDSYHQFEIEENSIQQVSNKFSIKPNNLSIFCEKLRL